ncbi:hypothetical protein HYPSUDRAFT_71239 [Hypholoma sublateritium FD-334 SS-4]|uniref:Uncharacterized protein n=1 Tax=Hypholoma sublateritium (strain FD-334 SS-4) TaxID=945553 RepID=A0A0D2NJH8_HYPSF|nr:hypothetical protein HYPSUDRAFT_71239 [Hypholoma sublateritium FD-334 SS-4]
MITKLYAVTIVATFNNRLNAIGGPPPPTDIETYFEDASKHYSRNNVDVSAKEIRIGRTVVQQVWKDDVPMSHLKIYEDDSTHSIKDDAESSRKVQESLTSDSAHKA